MASSNIVNFFNGMTTLVSYAKNASQSVVTGSIINFETQLYDPYSLVSTPSTNWVFTAPAIGFYEVAIAFAAVGTNSPNFLLTVNGAQQYYMATNSTGGDIISGGVVALPLNTGDKVTITVDASSTTVYGSGGTTPYNTRIEILLVE